MTPFIKTDKDAGCVYTLPCGRCPACAKRRTSGWSFRLMQEDKGSSSALFLTLTFDTSHVPITKNGFMNLDKREFQLFMKRLRKAHSEKLKYYAVGEYGGKTMRPHYHVILFNARVDLIQPAWPLGQVHYGTVSGASIGYTLKYLSKPKQVPKHRNDDRLPEFSLMSKGLGKSYLTDQAIAWHKADLEKRMYIPILDGKKIAMPRYFKDKMYHETEREIIARAAVLQHSKSLEEYQAHPDFETNERNRQAAIIAAFQLAKQSSTQNQKI